MPRPVLLASLLLVLAGCTTFPRIEARVPEAERQGPPPPLIDTTPLLAQARALAASPRTAPGAGAALAARAERLGAQGLPGGAMPGAAVADTARLRDLAARAEALRGAPVIAPAARDRLAAGVTRPAALQ